MIKWTDQLTNRFRRRGRRALPATAAPQQPQVTAWEPQQHRPAQPAPTVQWAPVRPAGGQPVDGVSELEAIAYAAGVLRDPWGAAR